jgi:hypothetical protein
MPIFIGQLPNFIDNQAELFGDSEINLTFVTTG